MKYLKLLALAMLAWAIVYAGALTLSLRSAGTDPRSAALALLEHNTMPGLLRPPTYSYTENGKSFAATNAQIAAYQTREAQKGVVDLVTAEHSGGYLLYLWCSKALPWLSLALTLWALNVAAGIKRLADVMG